MIGLGLLFAVVGAAVFTFLFAVPAFRTLESTGWETRPCTIVRSTVRSWSTDDGTSYRGDVLYEYSPTAATGARIASPFSPPLHPDAPRPGRCATATRRAPNLTAWVDPGDPTRSVLERDFRPRYLLGLMPLLFLFAGVALMRFGWKQLHAGDEREYADRPSGERRSAGPVVLKPQLSPIGKVMGTLFFALFWNGIVSIFVWQAWKALAERPPRLVPHRLPHSLRAGRHRELRLRRPLHPRTGKPPTPGHTASRVSRVSATNSGSTGGSPAARRG